MNIGIVCYPTYGGSGVVATELGKSLADKGHKVHFITYSQPVRLDIFEPNIYYHEVSVANYPLFEYQPYELALSSKMVDTVVKEKLDLLHVHYAIPHAYAAHSAKLILASQGIHIPVVTTLHGTDITLVGKHPSYKPAVTFSINESDIVTSVSDSLKEDTLNFFNVKKEIHVVPNFIDFSFYDYQEPCSKVFAPNGEKIITHISNFRPVKRVADVVKVFSKLCKELDAKLLMIGDGPDLENVEKMVDELGLSEKVLFLGKTKDVERILCMSDLFILPSETESFGLAALEAMAAKTPVISTNTGGLPEVNIHGVTGFLTDVGDVEKMASYACDILLKEEILAEFKQNAYSRAKEFDIEAIVPMYEELYNKALANIKA